MNRTMNKIDRELINKVIELTKKILKIYNNLYELELNNQKDSLEYQNNIKYLDLLIEMENNLYPKIPINKIDLYILYLDKFGLYKQLSDFTFIIKKSRNKSYFNYFYYTMSN